MQLVLRGEPDTAEHLLAVPPGGQRRLARRRLGEQEAQVVGLGGGGHQGRLGALDGDQCLGKPVPDRLERRDGPAELHTVQGMLARQ